MPPKKKRTGTKSKRGKRTREEEKVIVIDQNGNGFFSDVWKGIKKGANFIKDNKLLSRGLSAAGNLTGNSALKKAGNVAGQVGLGRGRRRAAVRIQSGGNLTPIRT